MMRVWPTNLPPAFPAVMPVLDGIGFSRIVDEQVSKEWNNGVEHSDVLTVLLLMILDRGAPQPLSQIAPWAEHMGIELLLGVPAEQLHDDKIGYTLDALVPTDENGECDLSILSRLHNALAHEAIQHYGIAVDVVHYDFTDVAFTGVYEDSALARRGKGPGRRQMNLGLNVTADGAFPVLATIHAGNENHMVCVPSNLVALTERLPQQQFCVVTDSAGICYDNIVAYQDAQQHFLGPRQLRQWEKEEVTAVERTEFRLSAYHSPKGDRYWLNEREWQICPEKKSSPVSVRAVVVVSEQKRARDQKKARKQMMKLIRRLQDIGQYAGGRGLYSRSEYVEEQAQKAVKASGDLAAFVTVEVSDGAEGPILHWRIDWSTFTDYRRRLGRYVLFSNLPLEDYSADRLVAMYHGRHVVESSYRQLKSVLQIAPVFLHKDNRLHALAWVYVIALMILSLLQRTARAAELTTKRKQPLTGRELLRSLWAVTVLVCRVDDQTTATIAPLPERAQHYLNAMGFPDPQCWLAVPPLDHSILSGI